MRSEMDFPGEPEIDEVLSDPIVHLVMRRDRIGMAEVRAAVDGARRRLKARALRARIGRDADDRLPPSGPKRLPLVGRHSRLE